MADLTCDICNQSVTTSAQCNHIRIAFEYVKVCIICGGAVEFDAVSFGYGSIYDGAVTCESCAEKYIDPAVTAAIAEKGMSVLRIWHKQTNVEGETTNGDHKE